MRADLTELMDMDLGGAPYGYVPFCDSRTEIDGFRYAFWKDMSMGSCDVFSLLVEHHPIPVIILRLAYSSLPHLLALKCLIAACLLNSFFLL